ncbi:MAG: MerR family transcriptional regulator, partial [Betaproteobacteria bacterium]|nr:MerR family transcriptional regulator [Betaproteobacteria bacterium]
MNERAEVLGVGSGVQLSISAVERDTGLSKDTLRVWERRYGFPEPVRDSLGERLYPVEQVERLRLIRRLMDAGHRPGKIMRMKPDQLQMLADQ